MRCYNYVLNPLNLQDNVQYCHSMKTVLLDIVLIRLLHLMWEQWLLIAVILVSFCSGMRFRSVDPEGHGLALILWA